jgi:hypothetical protein
LPEGPNEIIVTQVDPGGNTSEPTVVTPNIDTEAPVAPVVTGPKDGGDINTSTPEVTGTGEPGATVDVTDGGGNTLCQTTVQPDGTWSCTVTTPLPEGPNEIIVTQVDPGGNTSEPTVVKPVVDTVAPAQPVITQANATAVAGTAEPNATLQLTWPDGTTGTTLVDGNGQWSLPTPGNMVSGTVTAVAVDAAGNPSRPATAYLDLDGPGAPDILTANKTEIAGTAEPGLTVTVTYPTADGGTKTAGPVTVGPDGTWTLPTPADAISGPIKAVATDANGNPSAPGTGYLDVDAPAAPVVTGPKDGVTTNDRTPAVVGTGEPGATVTVTDQGGNTLCQTTVLPDGSWSCTVTTPLPEGPAEIRVTQTDPAGNPSAPTVVRPVIDTTAPDAPVITTANGREIAGTAEPGATVTVTYPKTDGTTGTVRVEVDENGQWSVPTPADATDGRVTAVATDPAGNTSARGTGMLDATAPAAPVVNPSSGGQITGTAEPGGVLTFTIGGQTISCTEGTVVADQAGAFVCHPTTPPLNTGDRVAVTVTDAAGNVSLPTVIVIGEVTIDITYPVRHPAETQVVTGGNFAPGEKVYLVLHSPEVGMGYQIADANGNVTFTFSVPTSVGLGQHTAVLSGDFSGTVSKGFTVTDAPTAPTGGTVAPAGLLFAGVAMAAAGTGLALANARRLNMTTR